MRAAFLAADKISPGKHLSGFVADFKLNFLDDSRWQYLLKGLGMTLLITLLSGLMGVVLGALVATVRTTWEKNKDNMHPGAGKTLLKLTDKLCGVYLTVIRGTPVMVQLLIMYLIIFAQSSDGTVAAVIAFGINSGAYVAEIIRGGIMSIDQGQFEAGRSLGFSYTKTMIYIILPQVLRDVLPALANEFIALLKETSVSGYVAVKDLNKGGEIIRSVTYSPFLPLIAVALIYLAVVMFFTKLVSILERRLRSSEHR
ncbi:MAG: amino acid ABC transporter permease [Clostridia bacterium]|nr:amino acid ABC transporter permease [Clostridia bacterium]